MAQIETFLCARCDAEKPLIPSLVIDRGLVQTIHGVNEVSGRFCHSCVGELFKE